MLREKPAAKLAPLRDEADWLQGWMGADLEKGAHLRRWQLSATLLVISSLLAIALSFISPRNALLALTLNLLAPLMRRWVNRPAMD